MKPSSLKRVLLKSLMIPLAGYVLIIGGFVYYTAIREINEVHDADLITAANVLYSIIEQEVSEGDTQKLSELDITDKKLAQEERAVFEREAHWRVFRVWHAGTLVTSSDSDQWKEIPPFRDGFTDMIYQGHAWRVYTLLVPDEEISVEMGEEQAARRYFAENIVRNLIWPFILSLPLALWLFSRGLEYGLNSLRKVTRQVNIRSPERMTPLSITQIPSDLIPLVDAINALLGKLSESLQREQQITDNAAHELRTPLAALKLQAQLAVRADCEEERGKALKALLSGIERVNHIVEQLLVLARIRNQSYNLISIDLVHAARHIADSLKPLLDQRHMRIVFEGDAVLSAKANDLLLGKLLTNIMDNALKYAPADSIIHIHAKAEDNRAILAITDAGPGIPEADRELVFERFYRIMGHGVAGSGLGLAIARECVERMSGSITLLTPDNGVGLTVSISLPLV